MVVQESHTVEIEIDTCLWIKALSHSVIKYLFNMIEAASQYVPVNSDHLPTPIYSWHIRLFSTFFGKYNPNINDEISVLHFVNTACSNKS